MSTNVNNYIRLTLPRTVAAKLIFLISDATKEAGGCTASVAQGQWFDKDGNLFVETVEMFQWNFKDGQLDDMRALTRAIVDAALEHGEKAVFRERYFHRPPVSAIRTGYHADIIHAPTKH